MRRLIASYGVDRILISDLCDQNPDEWTAGSLLNFADLIAQCFATQGRWEVARMCNSSYCVEVDRVPGGFLAYEVKR